MLIQEQFSTVKRTVKKHCKENCKSFVNTVLMNAKYSLIFYQYKMTQYNSLNVKLSNSQFKKLNSAIKN